MKKVLISLGIAFSLLLAAVIILPVIYKSQIVELVKKQANENLLAKVNFNNDIGLSLIKNFPNFTADIKDLSIVGINDFEGDTLVAWDKLEITLDLMSVIKGDQINIRKISLVSPRMHGLVLSNGKANWDITKPSADTTTTTSSEETKFKLSLKKLEITNANIVYEDKKSAMSASLVGFDYTMSGDFTQDEFILSVLSSIKQLSFGMGGVNYLNKVNTKIKADIDMNMPGMKFTFKENSFGLNDLTFNFDGFVQMLNEQINMDIKYDAPNAAFKSFLSLVPGIYTKDFASIKTSGSLGFNGFAKGTYDANNLPAFAFNLNIKDAMFQYPSLPVPVKDIQVKLAVTNNDGKLNSTLVNLEKFHMDVAGDAFDARLIAKNLMQDPNIDSWLKGRLNLGSVTKIVPLENGMSLSGVLTADVTAKGTVSSIEKQQYEAFDANGQIVAQQINFKSADLPQGFNLTEATLNFSPRIVTLKSFDANIGKSDIRMNGEVSNFFAYLFSDGIINGKLNLNANLIDANQFLSNSSDPATPAATDTTSMQAPEIPANINFVFNSSIKQLLYSNMEITNFAGGVTIKDQKLSFNNINLNTLGAGIGMNGFYETTNPLKPSCDIDFAITNLDIPTAFATFNTIKKLAPAAEKMTGSFSTTFKMTTLFDQHLNPIYPSLFALGNLTLKNAELKDVKVLSKLAEVLKNDKYKNLALNDVKVQYKVENGRVYTEPFQVKAAGKVMTLSGSTGLDQTIDYKGTTDVQRGELGAINNALESSLKDLNNKLGSNINMSQQVKVGMNIGGTFSNPEITTNLADIAKSEANSLKDQAKAELERQKKLLEDKAKAEAERLKKEAEDKVKAEADKARQKAQEEADRLKKEAEAKAQAEKERLKKQAEEEAKKKLKGILKP